MCAYYVMGIGVMLFGYFGAMLFDKVQILLVHMDDVCLILVSHKCNVMFTINPTSTK